LLLALFSGL